MRMQTVARHARLLTDTQAVSTTIVRACTHLFDVQMHKTAARLQRNDLALYCTAATRMVQNVLHVLLMELTRLTQGGTCDSLANLQDHLATALQVNVRQS